MRSFGSVLLGIALLVCSLSCATSSTPPPATAAAAPQAITLNVGLYPWVPRLSQFEQAIDAAWAKVHPGVTLHYVTSWDGGYDHDPNAFAMDVYVFDAVFLDDFRTQGWLSPLSAAQIDHLSDFLPYAIDGVEHQGSYYGIPMLGCAEILFYRQGDTALANATTLSALESALGQCTYTSEVPPDVRGLMIDMAGGTTNACLYAEAVESLNGQWPVPLPTPPSPFNAHAVANLQTLMTLSSFYGSTTSTSDPYQRAKWFGEGFGRATVGFTESMSQMGAATLSKLELKILPLGDHPSARPLFYSDIIGISPTTAHLPLALELANLMASTNVMVASTGPSGGQGPQYLMPVRPSIFQAFSSDPIYRKMDALVSAANPILLNLGPGSRSWIGSSKNAIKAAVRKSYPCGCDQSSTSPILDDSQAAQECPPTCSSHGGWNGQWRTLASGTSVCGCNTCPGT